MAKVILQTAIVMLVTLAVANAVIIAVNQGRRRLGRRRFGREALAQNVPMDCKFEFNVPKRDGSNEVDFILCVKNGDICTSKFVKTCSDSRINCDGFTPESVNREFHKLYRGAYAKVCEEPIGENCLYTDVKYEICGQAKEQDDDQLCITLSNGEKECAEIPEEKIQQLVMMSQIQQFLSGNSEKLETEIQQFTNNEE